MSDIIIPIFFIATIVGFKKPIYGSIAGLVLSTWYCYFKSNIGLYSWVLIPIFGALFGYLFPFSARWMFSGLKGGIGKTEPGTTYIGGFGLRRLGQYFGKMSPGIIPSDNEETGWTAHNHLIHLTGTPLRTVRWEIRRLKGCGHPFKREPKTHFEQRNLTTAHGCS